ncbi:MAG: hypothetical protein Q8O13_01415 [Candidatus Omnitrophota bacterium]|nr:hypothetical protein [Candidatus Omnitrophota bacterium]
MKITKETRNELFSRKEVNFIIESEKNPSFSDTRKIVAEHFKKPEENIEVYSIYGKFGRKTFLVKSYIYDSKKDLDNAVQKTQKQRKEEAKALAETEKAHVESKK